MYSLSWARSRTSEHSSHHTRATDILCVYFSKLTPRLHVWLASGHPEWEAWKYLVRMVENSLGIRQNPNTTSHLLTERAFRCLDVILLDSFHTNPKYILTGLEVYRTLYEQLRVREPGTPTAPTEPLVPDEGQLDLF